ncbi:MAG: hypothetical protein WDW38_007865 [Sanguina aurantia]
MTAGSISANTLWKGALEVMYTAARSPDILCSFTQANKMMQGRSFPLCPSAVDALDELGTPALILWQAGGNFGDLWTFVQHPRMQMIQAFDALIDADERYAGYNLTILQLPQSVFYTNQNVMKKEAHILRNLKRVRFVLTTRATASYDIAVNEMRLPVENVFAVPDIASAAGPFLGSDPPLVDIVLMPRSDREAKLTPLMAAEIVNRTATAAGLTFKARGSSSMHTRIGLLTQGQVVITDLMHTSLMSMLSGKPVFFWDGGVQVGYNKVGGMYGMMKSASNCSDDDLGAHYFASHNETDDLVRATNAAVAYVLSLPCLGVQ